MAKPRESRLTEVAAAAAVTGAVAVGGKLAKDKLSADRRADAARTYRLERAEYIPDGMRRIARGQLDAATRDLADQPNRKLYQAFHETRKRLKRLRASLRFERSAIGRE